MAKARTVEGLASTTRFGDAGAAVVAVRASEVFEHATGVLDIGDIERVHAMRVATRRLRAAMEVFATCFPSKEHRRLLKEVKRLADALGERRDPDVAIEELERLADELEEADRPGVASLISELRREQALANRVVGEALLHARTVDLEPRLQALAATARNAAAGPPERGTSEPKVRPATGGDRSRRRIAGVAGRLPGSLGIGSDLRRGRRSR